MGARFYKGLVVLCDLFTALISWILFYYLRKLWIEQTDFKTSEAFYFGISIIPVCWVLLYYLQGTYHNIKRLYRFKIFNLSLSASVLGGVMLFFALILDDQIQDYHHYYKSFLLLVSLHFTITTLPRLIWVTWMVKKIQHGRGRFRTLIIGGGERALEVVEVINQESVLVNDLVGFINYNGEDNVLGEKLPHLGDLGQLEKVVLNHNIEEIIIALESTEHSKLNKIISRIGMQGVVIKVLPDMYDILSGSVRMTSIFGALLIEVNMDNMPIWQQSIKRFFDVVLSSIALICLIPVFVILAILVKFSSKGPIFFTQERIGRLGKGFQIIKFRTMVQHAEQAGPQLSSTHDPRITSVGRIFRKLRLDELPQFINVIKGDMSLVGPRPERQFYINKIVQIEPEFIHLNQVRPGITSWGQVKYGYAENVEQMLQRMKFDLLYLRNRSLALDFKIMLYTILIIIKAKGK